MSTQRTGGMTTIGILNIIFGSLGTLICLLMVLGGGLMAVGGAAMEADMGADAEGMAEMAAAGGGIIMVIGLVGAISCALLAVAGIGVLKCAPWGRTLSMLCCGVLVLVSITSLIFGGVAVAPILMLAFAGTQIGLFMKADWKAAFGGQAPMNDMTSITSASPIPGGTSAASAAAAPKLGHHSDDDSMQSAA